jgi:hypothetical protein
MAGAQIAGNGDDDGVRIRRALPCKRSVTARRKQNGQTRDGCLEDCAHPEYLACSLPLTTRPANSYLMAEVR